MRFATECFLILTMAQMWNLLAGYAGLVSFGHQVFVAIGAYGLFTVSGLARDFSLLGLAGGARGLCGGRSRHCDPAVPA